MLVASPFERPFIFWLAVVLAHFKDGRTGAGEVGPGQTHVARV